MGWVITCIGAYILFDNLRFRLAKLRSTGNTLIVGCFSVHLGSGNFQHTVKAKLLCNHVPCALIGCLTQLAVVPPMADSRLSDEL